MYNAPVTSPIPPFQEQQEAVCPVFIKKIQPSWLLVAWFCLGSAFLCSAHDLFRIFWASFTHWWMRVASILRAS